MKKLLILGAGILQTAVIEKAKELGLYTIVADGDSEAKGLLLADKPLVVNITNPEQVFDKIKDMNIDGVIHPCSEVAMNTMGFINDRLHLSGIGLEIAIMATNKNRMRQAFEKGNAPSPKSYEASSFFEFIQKLNLIHNIAIIKPSRNSGSRGVSCVNKEMTDVQLKDAFNNAIENSRDKSVVVEEYIDGPEFSVEIVIWNQKITVLTITDKLTTGVPHFVELGHSQPSLYSEEDQKIIKEAAVKGCVALQLSNCVAHAEIKLQNGKPYIMEIGARLGGDFISTELVHLSTGIDMVSAAINVALGEEPDLEARHFSQGAAIRYFTPPHGIIDNIDLSSCIVNENIYDFKLYKKNNDIINEISSSLDRSGHVIAIGKNAAAAINNAEVFIKEIRYSIN